MIEWAEVICQRVVYYRKLFGSRIPVLEVQYDEVCKTDETGTLSEEAIVGRLLDFLGVEHRP